MKALLSQGDVHAQVQINRAPVITLWVAAVAQRQGFSREAALTFGKYISGMLAQSKGRAIGIYEDSGKSEEEKAEARQKEEAAGIEHVDVFGMKVKAVKVSRGRLIFAIATANSSNPSCSPLGIRSSRRIKCVGVFCMGFASQSSQGEQRIIELAHPAGKGLFSN